MGIFRRIMQNEFNVRDLYVVTTGKVYSTGMFISRYVYHPDSIAVIQLKGKSNKTVKDVITGRRYLVFGDNISHKGTRTYCDDIKPLYNFFTYGENKNILSRGFITLDELCVFLADMNDSFYKEVFNRLEIIQS